MGETCGTYGDMGNAYIRRIFMGKLEKIRVIGRPVERWKNVKMDLKLIWRAWIGLM
jgi:hypothetical protein